MNEVIGRGRLDSTSDFWNPIATVNELTRESVIRGAREAAEQSGKTMSRVDFERITGINEYHIYRLFPDGGWSEVLKLAGLTRHPRYHPRMSDQDLLAEYHRVVSHLGEIPSWSKFDAEARVSASVVKRRFGGLQATLERYLAWLVDEEPSSPLLPAVRERCARTQVALPESTRPAAEATSRSGARWPRAPGALEYGAPIDFRGLRHAPVNEHGVVYLFGLVSRDLGFLVEAIGAAYPDCEAKRCVDQRRDRWQRLRIEFEYLSSNFREHGHDTAGCDVIICWEHDWLECPLEVIELRRVIKDLPK